MRSTRALIMFLMLLNNGCTSSESSSDSTASSADVVSSPTVNMAPEPQSAGDENKILLAKECPPKETVCTMNYAPVVCSASKYDGKAQAPSTRLMVWAGNGCSGRMRLNREACARSLVPSKLGSIQCVPDATSGHCPVSSVNCKTELKPMTCSATAYAGHPLSEEQSLAASGQNECLAKVELQMMACRANLDPTQLGGVECRRGSSKASP